MPSIIRRIVAAGLACCALSACATVTPPPASTSPPAGLVQGQDLATVKKAEAEAEVALQSAASTYLQFKDQVQPATRAQAKAALDTAYAGIKLARKAIALNDAAGALAQITNVQGLIAQLHTALGH